MIKVFFVFRNEPIADIETHLKFIPNKNDVISFDELKFDFGEYCYDVFKVKTFQYNIDSDHQIESVQITLKKIK